MEKLDWKQIADAVAESQENIRESPTLRGLVREARQEYIEALTRAAATPANGNVHKP